MPAPRPRCRGCGYVTRRSHELNAGFCVLCEYDLTHLSRDEIREQLPDLYAAVKPIWDELDAAGGVDRPAAEEACHEQ